MFNIIYCLYNLQEELKQIHIDNWKKYPKELRKKINIILVDDYSDIPFELDLDFPINLTVVRVMNDKGYNIGGAKNLGFYIANEDWCFSSDIDHILIAEECRRCLDLKKERNKVYYFERWLSNGRYYFKRHKNTYIIHKNDFYKVGRYDEDFTPHYGYEDEWLKFLMEKRGIKFADTDIKVILYNIPNNEQFLSYPMWKRKRDRKINNKLLFIKKREYNLSLYKANLVLRFKWKVIQQYKIER